MTEATQKSCDVYKVSDAIKEHFKDEEDLLPVVDIHLEDMGRIVWRFQVYSLDERDVRTLVDLANDFSLGISSITQNAKNNQIEIKLSTKVSLIRCDGQKFGLAGKHAR